MRDFRAVFYFDAGGLFVTGDALGLHYELTRDGHCVGIRLPNDEEVYTGFPPPSGQQKAVSGRVVAWQEDPYGIHAVTVDRFEVTVGVSADTPAGEVIGEAFPLAAQIAEEFLTWVRVGANQPWLPSEHEGVALGFYTRLLDVGTGKEVQPRVAWNPPMVVFAHSTESAADGETINDMVGAVSGGIRPGVAARLLTDAHAVVYPRGAVSAANHERADTAHTVLVAAMACEVHIKTVLRAKAAADQVALLDVILDSPRETSIAAGQLTDKPMKAAIGHSLREDDKGLYIRVTEKLFPIRNKVAHRGYKPSLEETREVLQTADELFLWLNGLPATAG